jgi:hypothetical protein
MGQIWKFISNILTHHDRLGKDKLAHFYSASLGFALFTFLLGDIYASIIVALAALYKELINDWKNEKGNPEVLDAVMSILPILLYWLTKL